MDDTNRGQGFSPAGIAAAAAGMMPGFADIVSAAISVPHKRIYWEDGAWRCEPLVVKVFRSDTGKGKEQFDLDPAKTVIKISDTRNWLESKATKKEGKSLLVEIKLRDGVSIAPEQSPSAGENTAADKAGKNRISVLPAGKTPPCSPPAKAMGTSLTIELYILEDIAGAAKAAAVGAGMPGLGQSVAEALGRPKINLPAEKVAYIVEPPTVMWTLDSKDMIKLNGTGQKQKFSISAVPNLPPRWLEGIQVSLSLPEDKSRYLGVNLAGAASRPDKPEQLTADIEVSSSKLIIRPQTEYSETYVPSTVMPLVVGARSPYLGQQVSELSLDALAMEVCVYFEKEPAENYFGQDRSRYLRVLKKSGRSIPRYASLKVELRMTPGFPDQSVSWSIPENDELGDTETGPQLDDRLTVPGGTVTLYVAPSEEIWKNCSPAKLESRLVRCKIGDNEETLAIKEEPHLYETFITDNNIYLTEPLRNAILKVKLGPAAIIGNTVQLDLNYETTLASLVREFIIDLDLEAVAHATEQKKLLANKGEADR